MLSEKVRIFLFVVFFVCLSGTTGIAYRQRPLKRKGLFRLESYQRLI